MANMFFSIPDVYSGNNAIMSLRRFSSKRVAIVTDAFMVSSGKVQDLIDVMPEASVSIFSDVKPDPGVDVLKDGAIRFKAFKPEVIIALGGGSSQDAAKGIKVTLEEHYGDHCIELVSVPTTSGSGSEVTSYAVISDTENGQKYPLVSPDLLPDSAILDPQLVLSVPRQISADTGMDVLTHAIEALVSTGANDFSNALAEKAITLTICYLPKIFVDEKDISAREHMHNASCMAGMAFNSAGLGLVHGMAHAIGGMLHIPHGKINAMLLPVVIEFNSETNDPDILACYNVCARMMSISESSEARGIQKLTDKIRSLNQQFGIPSTLTELGKSRDELESVRALIIESALSDGCTETNPRKPTVSDVNRLFSRIVG
ncbi:1-propanol dehydrogenase PduQ [Vibrio salinus]|uniref:1-propanol dehydrogenase PduQ n=1 Tax=Vibrio salinus TaxID=2899784 RepID=UPI001E329911|nr:1-propanol dehydrogenase PduQ [Vibrio salinus]MCE0495492.1 iron-containing alcohol dehydrogenase [Vibrio salinus]